MYFADTASEGFNACFLVKKEIREFDKIKIGSWDAIHIVNCTIKGSAKADYRVISTILITLDA